MMINCSVAGANTYKNESNECYALSYTPRPITIEEEGEKGGVVILQW